MESRTAEQIIEQSKVWEHMPQGLKDKAVLNDRIDCGACGHPLDLETLRCINCKKEKRDARKHTFLQWIVAITFIAALVLSYYQPYGWISIVAVFSVMVWWHNRPNEKDVFYEIYKEEHDKSKRINKIIIKTIAIILFVTFIWPTIYMYVPSGDHPIRINRITGTAQVLENYGWTKIGN